MAKYAFAYVTVILLAAGVLIFGAAQPFIFMDRQVGFGQGGVALPEPLPGPVEPLPADLPLEERPPDLIVTDANHPTPLTPITFCWTTAVSGVCSDGMPPPPGEEPVFLGTADTPVHLDFQTDWEVSIEVTPDAALACDPWVWPLGNVSSAFVDTLGPPGEYVLSVSAANANGDAYWVLRIDNQADLPTPEGVSC